MYPSCQEDIIAELKRRIDAGDYTEMLPPASQLAGEFRVNVKTMNKALNRLAAAGVVERRKRFGTAVRPSGGAVGEARMIEVVFSGFTAPFLHPFWSEVLKGLHDVFSAAGCRMILNHIVSEPETHLFDLSRIRLSEAAGRVVVGPGEKRLLDWIAATRRPMICAGDEVSDPDMPGVFFDFTRGIGDAIDYLGKQRKCRRIGFIGHIEAWINPGMLQKFHAYLHAVQRYMQMDRALIEGCWPKPGNGRTAVRNLLARTRPDALLVASDLLIPEIAAELEAQGIRIPLVGCDGLRLEKVPDDYRTISAARRECGRRAARLLLDAMDGKLTGKIGRHAIEAEFR